jgi:site-specific recombinase XerD
MIEELHLRNYSELTVEGYLDSVEAFAKYFWKNPEHLGPEQIQEYLLHLVEDKHAAANRIQVHRAALKFLYVKTLKQPWFDEQVAWQMDYERAK